MPKASRSQSSPHLFTAELDEGKTKRVTSLILAKTKSIQVHLSVTADIGFEAIRADGKVTHDNEKETEKNSVPLVSL